MRFTAAAGARTDASGMVSPSEDNVNNSIRELEARLIQGKSAVECLAVLISLAELHAATHRNREGLRCAREALNIARARNDKISAARALPHISRQELTWRLHFVMGALSYTAAGTDALRIYSQVGAEKDNDELLLQRLAPFLVAGLKAPALGSTPKLELVSGD